MKLFKLSIILILTFIILLIAEANAKILYTIKQLEISFGYDVAVSVLKALGFAFSTIIIIIYYPSWLIKAGFILADMAIIHIYTKYSPENWWAWSSYIYPLFVGIIMAFIGNIARSIYLEKKGETHSYANEIAELDRAISGLKQMGRGKRWYNDPQRVDAVKELEEKKNKLLQIEKNR